MLIIKIDVKFFSQNIISQKNISNMEDFIHLQILQLKTFFG